MTDLLDLSDELLLNVTTNLRPSSDDFKEGYSALKSLSLVCRRLRPISQDALFRSIVIQNLKEDVIDFPRIAKLVRTFLERPELAKRVQSCELSLKESFYTPISNERGQMTRKSKGIFPDGSEGSREAMLVLGEAFCAKIRREHSTTVFDDEWMSRYRNGSNQAMVGILLTLTSRLGHLALDLFRTQTVRYHDDEHTTKLKIPETFSLTSLFGCMSGESSILSKIATLESIRSSNVLPAPFYWLPGLKEVRLVVSHRTSVPKFQETSDQLEKLFFTNQIHTFTVDVDPFLCSPGSVFFPRAASKVLGDLVPKFANLRSLTLWLLPLDRHTFTNNRIDFGFPTKMIASESLETLSIDTTSLNTTSLSNRILAFHLGNDVWPAQSFTRLPRLRHLKGPQEMFFAAHQSLATCVLPVSIESIDIFDSTHAVKRYMNHLVNNKHQHPSLTDISFRLRHRTEYMVTDTRIKWEVQTVETGEIEEAETSWAGDFDFGDFVWDYLKDIGIKVHGLGTAVLD
ncbi:hypothetical protein CC80DRAFT_496182 [Byssothecium circinans]|uniref:F-box domain-containing protein n=1 Tax=Byssothecium circinans TaxID=147558 RepID=A0A6A5TR35_9PLEO|nr:hypothetical protein CC80DRAFT_496182 [Byssothecium circinans]